MVMNNVVQEKCIEILVRENSNRVMEGKCGVLQH